MDATPSLSQPMQAPQPDVAVAVLETRVSTMEIGVKELREELRTDFKELSKEVKHLGARMARAAGVGLVVAVFIIPVLQKAGIL
jgi:hypothetical protein